MRYCLRCDIGDIRSVVTEMVKGALFANEVSIINSHHNKLVAEKEQQRAVNAFAERSNSKKMAPLRQGLPQDAVLSPPLFLLYIDDLRSVVPETVKVMIVRR